MISQGYKFLIFTLCGLCSQIASATPCTSDYKTASQYFQSVLGDDAGLERVPSFKGQISTGMNFETENSIKDNGGSVMLEINIKKMGAIVPVPVQVCNEGGKLTARLIMSTAVLQKNGVNTPVKVLNSKIPDQIVMVITRDASKNVVFKSETFPNEPASSVSVR